MSEDQFWKTTPAELNQLTREYGEQQKSEVGLLKASAYWVASLSRAKTMPSYRSWISERKAARSLVGEEAEARKKEHEEIVARFERHKQEREMKDG